MKNKKLILIISTLLIALTLTTTGILAWLTDKAEITPIEFTVGKVSYTWVQGNLKSNPVVPGDNLVTSNYTLTNNSTVASELRIAITIVDEDDLDASNLMTIALGSGWVLDNGYYYYRPNAAVDGKYPIATSVTSITVISGLTLNGATVGNEHAGQTFTISIYFEAKQNDHVTWTQLGSINFETGLA